MKLIANWSITSLKPLIQKYILFVFLILLGLSTKSQQDFPWENGTWSEHFRYQAAPYSWYDLYYSFTINGDTIIKGKWYAKVYLESDNSYIGGIREDFDYYYFSDMGKVYFYPAEKRIPISYCNDFANDTTEHLLYDFGANEGDTIYYDYGWSSLSYYIVTKVDYITINGNDHKYMTVYHQENAQEEHWIEGIGSDYGLFGTYCFPFEWSYELLCFNSSTTDYATDAGEYLGCHYTGLSEPPKSSIIEQTGNAISVLNLGKEGYAEVFNLIGQEIYHSKLQQGNNIINIIDKGIYIVRVTSDERRVTKKVYIQ